VGYLNSGGSLTEARYYPFGTLRHGYGNTSRMFTGQQSEVGALGSQVHYYHARFYSPQYAHFVSADTLTVDGLNRYAYAKNQPVNNNDPTGRCINGLDCSEWTATKWLVCAFWGACVGANASNHVDVMRLARWGLFQAEFFDHVNNFVEQNPVFEKVVKSIRATVEGESRVLKAGIRGVGVGAEGSKIDEHRRATGIPGSLVREQAAGVARWTASVSYLDFKVTANL
jgi:RHS repeat-associated protein